MFIYWFQYYHFNMVGIFDKLFARNVQGGDDFSEDYVEISSRPVDKTGKAKVIVRPFVVEDFADIKPALDAIREGYTIALVNIKPLKDKDLVELKRAVGKLKKTCDAIEGDIAGFGEDWIVVTPSFAQVYRNTQTEELKEDKHYLLLNIMEVIKGETCPVCFEKKLSLVEDEQDIPYFGKVFLMAMNCSSCGYKVSDVEAEQQKEGCKYEFVVKSSKDLNVRVVKSSEASVKIPQLRLSVDPGVGSDGYVSNIEGLLNRFKKILESERDSSDDENIKKKAKNLLKKLWKVECGDEELKIIIEDPSGNSAIISDKAIVSKFNGNK